MNGWTALHQQILGSSVWSTPYHVRILWVSMLAMSDRNGIVRSSVPGLARLANITREEAEEGLRVLMEPDPDTQTQEHEGRRVKKVEQGWLVLNHHKYRAVAKAEMRKEAARLGMQTLREKRTKTAGSNSDDQPATQTPPEPQKPQGGAIPAQGGALQDENYRGKPPTLDMVQAMAYTIGLPPAEAKKFFDHYEAMSKDDENGRPVWVIGDVPVGKWPNLLAKWAAKWREQGYRYRQKTDPLLPEPPPIVGDNVI